MRLAAVIQKIPIILSALFTAIFTTPHAFSAVSAPIAPTGLRVVVEQPPPATFTYYVDSAMGSDTNPGTEAQPWRTISKVNAAALTAGQSVGFKRGKIWREQLTVPSSGSAGNPITLGAYGTGPNPIISGANLVSAWSADRQANTWQATLTSQPLQVYFDGRRGTKVASLPSVNGANKWYWASNVLYVYSTSDPDTAYIAPGIEASVRRYGISAVNKSYLRIDGIDTTKAGFATANSGYNVSIGGGGNNILQNFLTTEGYHSGVFIGNSSDNNLVYNVEATLNGGVILDTSTNGVGIGVWNPGADNNVISTCNVHDNYGSGITTHGSEASVNGPNRTWIHHNTTSGNGGKGISVTMALNTLVEYNIVSGNGIGATQTTVGDGIRVSSGDLTVPFGTGNIIRHNTIFNNAVNCITLYQEINPQVYYNVCYGNGSDATDEGNGITVSGFDGGAIYNNVSYNSRKYGLSFQRRIGANIVAKNNIIHTSRGRSAGIFVYANAEGFYTTDYNVVYNIANFGSSAGTLRSLAAWQAAVSQDAHSMNSNPLFTSTVIPDFHLQVGSPAIGAGAYIAGISTSNPPNIGAK